MLSSLFLSFFNLITENIYKFQIVGMSEILCTQTKKTDLNAITGFTHMELL